MKKTYIRPTLTAYEVCPQQVLAQSTLPVSEEKALGDYDGGGDVKGQSNLWDEIW